MSTFPHGRGRVCAALCLLLLCGSAAAQEPWADPLTGSGDGTYYVYAPGNGRCSFAGDDTDPMVAAMNGYDYANSQICGQWVRVTGPLGSVDVRIVDECPQCLQGDIDLNQPAFEAVANLADGRVPITWEVIPAPSPGKCSYTVSQGTNPWFLQVQVRDHRYGIASLEYLAPSGYVAAPRSDYNYFTIDSSLGVAVPLEDPFTVRITDVNGQTLVQSGIPLVAGSTHTGDSQFPVCIDATASPPAAARSVVLHPPHPNPFNPRTTLSFELEQAGSVRVEILDAAGRRVARLLDRRLGAGSHELQWNGTDDSGRPAASGVYFCRVREGGNTATVRVVMLK